MRTFLKRTFGLGALAGLAYAAWVAWQRRAPRTERTVEWASAPFPFPPEPRPVSRPPGATAATAEASAPAAPAETAGGASVEPAPDGSCPVTHPVKAKLASGIYHVPGGANYARTKADRCYADEDAAASDGLRRSKA